MLSSLIINAGSYFCCLPNNKDSFHVLKLASKKFSQFIENLASFCTYLDYAVTFTSLLIHLYLHPITSSKSLQLHISSTQTTIPYFYFLFIFLGLHSFKLSYHIINFQLQCTYIIWLCKMVPTITLVQTIRIHIVLHCIFKVMLMLS